MPRIAIQENSRSSLRAESLRPSRRDSLRVLELLEKPPGPNPRMMAAVRALPKRK